MIGSSLAPFATTKLMSSLFAKERHTSTYQPYRIIPHISDYDSGDIVMMPNPAGRDAHPSPAETRSAGARDTGSTAVASTCPDTESQDQDASSVSVTGLSGYSVDLSVCSECPLATGLR